MNTFHTKHQTKPCIYPFCWIKTDSQCKNKTHTKDIFWTSWRMIKSPNSFFLQENHNFHWERRKEYTGIQKSQAHKKSPSWYLIEIIGGKLFTRPNIWNWKHLSAYFSDQLEILYSQEMLPSLICNCKGSRRREKREYYR